MRGFAIFSIFLSLYAITAFSYVTRIPQFSGKLVCLTRLRMADNSLYDQFATAVDKSVLGLFKTVPSHLLNSLRTFELPLISTLSSTSNSVYKHILETLPTTPSVSWDFNNGYEKLPFRFPALEANIRQLFELLDNSGINIDATLLSTNKLSGWLGYLDISTYNVLPETVNALLLSQPAVFRLGVGLLLLEVIPFFINVFIWQSLFSVDVSKVDTKGLPRKYDKDQIEKYYLSHPALVISRIVDIFVQSQELVFGLWMDSFTNKWNENRALRALQLRQLLTQLGPAYIKVGQALSVRPDLLDQEYLVELGKLQDQVPPFESKLALSIISKELGVAPEEVFDSMSSFDAPIAAASLGQVYEARLKTGEPVAVKVQRPNMLLTVTLDLFVTRSLFVLGTLIPDIAVDCANFVGVVDNWAGRFVDELDYVTEASNSERFRMQMADKTTTLGDAVVVPKVFSKFSSDKVLVSEWIVGTKLSEIDITREDGRGTVRKLTRVLLNCYLVQLLETGFLHADPHPGNFKVTSDGKLCILDFGLMTELDEDRRLGLMEYVARLLAKDYNATLESLVVLGFVPREVTDDPRKQTVVATLLGNILEQLSAGGGAKAVNLDQVRRDVEKLSDEYPIIIPPYFALVLRAFGALEGLGLSVDGSYSIVQECFPYLARRLLSDDSPRIRTALRTFLYGKEGRLNLRRVDDLATGYRTFTQTAADAASGKAFEELKFVGVSESTLVSEDTTDPTLTAAVRVLFSTQGNYVQELLLEELVRVADALSRSVSMTILRSVRAPLQSLSSRVGSSRSPDANEDSLLGQLFEITPDDLDALRTLKRILQILAKVDSTSVPSPTSTGVLDREDLQLVRVLVNRLASVDLGGGNARVRLRSLVPLFNDIAPGLTSLGIRFGRRLAGRSLTRIADKISNAREL